MERPWPEKGHQAQHHKGLCGHLNIDPAQSISSSQPSTLLLKHTQPQPISLPDQLPWVKKTKDEGWTHGSPPPSPTKEPCDSGQICLPVFQPPHQ